MRILMLSPFVPWPLNSGSKIRVYHILKELSYSNDITFIALSKDNEQNGMEAMRPLCSKLYTVPIHMQPRGAVAIRSIFSFQPYGVARYHNRGLEGLVNGVLQSEPFDVVWIHFPTMCAYLPSNLSKRLLIILDQHNAEELMWNRYTREGPLWRRFFAWQNLLRERHYQTNILQKIDIVLSVSEPETEFMLTRAPETCQVWTVPNGVDIEYFRSHDIGREEKKKNIVLFCGSLDVTMNIDAVLRFAKKIFPFLKKTVADAEFWIVGRNSDARVQSLAKRDGIKVVGEVQDVRLYYEHAKAVIAPFRYGGGTKLKVLEAMAMGVPVVATTIGCQGIEATAGTQLLVEDDNVRFAQRVGDVLENPEIRGRLVSEGRKLVEEKYSWECIVADTRQRLENLILKKQGII